MSLAYAITSGGTAEGGAIIPPPPAVTGAWLTGLGYWTMKYGVLWLAGYQGTLTPPAGTDTDHITAIRISRLVNGQRTVLLSLAGPFPVGGARAFKSDAVDVLFSGPVTLEFITENEDGSTATYTTTVTLTAPSEASVTAAEATPISTTRHQTENRGVRCVLNFTPVINNPLWPMPVTIWTNHPGSVRKHRGVYEMTGPGQMQLGAVGTKSEFDIIPPTAADESWTLTYAIGSFDEFTAPPASAKTSTPFTMLRPPAPGATEATGAYVDAITYAQGPGGAYLFGLPHIYGTLPLGSNNFLHGRLMLQTGSGTGGSFVAGGAHPLPWNVGDWVNDDDHSEGFYRVPGTNQIYCNVPNVWDVPSDGKTTHRLWWVVASRRDGGTEVQQNCWSSGVGVSTPGTAAYQDVVVDGTKSQIPVDGSLTRDASTGKYKLNTRNLSNLLFNGGFEELNTLAPWIKLRGDEIGWQGDVGWFAFSGTSDFTDRCNDGAGIIQNGVSCRAGDTLYAECYVNAGFGTVSGSAYLAIDFYDNAGALVAGGTYAGVAVSNGMGWTKIAVNATAPAGASSFAVRVQLLGATGGTGYWYIDSVFACRQIPTGDGTEPDGKGGVRWRPGAGTKTNADGSAGVNTGPGNKVDAFGRVVPNLGSNLGVNGSDQVVVPSSVLGEGVFVGGVLGTDLTKWSTTKVPYGIYFGLPSVFDANVPGVVINTAETPWKVYRKNGGVWEAVKTNAADLTAGTINALVSLNSPTINGGSISGNDVTISAGNVTVSIGPTAADGFPGLRVRDAGANATTIMGPGGIKAYATSTPAISTQITTLGIILSNGTVTKIITPTSTP